MDIFIEINIFEDGDGFAYSAVLDSDGEPVVLCDGITDTRRAALDATYNHLKTIIR